MAEQRKVEIERLVSNIEQTRQAIARTVGELTHRVRETMDWRQQAIGHPAASLGAAAVVGFMLGRIVGSAFRWGGRPQSVVRRPDALPAAGLLGRMVSAVDLARELAFVSPLLAQLASLVRSRR
jgi:hypothetical protein